MSKHDEQEEYLSDEVPRTRRRFWPYLLGIVLVLFLLCPNIIGWTGQTESLVNQFVDLNGKVKIGSSSLGWLSGITLQDVAIVDSEGKELATVKKVATSKSLFNLASNQSKLGKITIEGADASVIVRKGGSDLEDVFAKLMEPSEEESSSPTPSIEIELLDSSVTLGDGTKQARVTIEKANVNVQSESNKVSVQLNGAAENGTEAPKEGNFEIAGTLLTDLGGTKGSAESEATSANAMQGSFDVSSIGLGLAAIEPVALRFGEDISVNGSLHSNLKLSIDGMENIQVTVDKLKIPKLRVAAPNYIEHDKIAVSDLTITGSVDWQMGKLVAKQLEVRSNLVSASLEGEFDIQQITDSVSNGVLADVDFSSAGEINVAEVARSFPGLLKIREGLEVQKGKLVWQTFSRLEGERRRIFANVEASELVAQDGNTTISWDRPVKISAAIRQASTGIQLQRLDCKSEFMTATGAGEIRAGKIEFNANLNRLKKRLSDFLDLSEYRLGGQLVGAVNWQSVPTVNAEGVDPIKAAGGFTIDNFVFVAPGSKPIQEKQLVGKLDGVFQASNSQIESLDNCQVRVDSADDHLVANLAQQVKNPFGESANWVFDLGLQGQAKNWLRRAKAFVDLPVLNLKSDLDIAGKVAMAGSKIRFISQRLTAKKFSYLSPSFRIIEPEIKGAVDLIYNLDDGSMKSNKATFTSSSIALNAKQLEMQNSDNFKLNGSIDFRADLQRLMRWFETNRAKPVPYFGKLAGSIDLKQVDLLTRVVVKSDLENFQYAGTDTTTTPQNSRTQKLVPLWTEDKIALNANASYDAKRDKLEIQKVRAAGKGVIIDGKGPIHQLSTTCKMNLSGTIDADTFVLAKRLSDTFGVDIRMRGREANKFTIRGKLFVPEVATGEPASQTSKVPAQLTSNKINSVPNTGLPSSVVNSQNPNQRSGKKGSQGKQKSAGKNADEFTAFAQVRWEGGDLYGLNFGTGRAAFNVTNDYIDVLPVSLRLAKGKMSIDPIVWMNEKDMVVEVSKGRIFDRSQISPEMCRKWMKFMAPMLADATSANGEFSLQLDENAVVPLSNPMNGTLSGYLVMHSAKIGPGPLGEQFISIANSTKSLLSGNGLGILGKALGKTGLGTNTNPSNTTLINMSGQKVAFKMLNGRVYHDKLTFNIKGVPISTRGSVGADQSLDLVASVPLSAKWVEKAGIAAKLLKGADGKTIEIPIQGTISKPKLQLTAMKNLSNQLLKDTAGKLINEKANDLIEGGLKKGLDKFLDPFKRK